MCIAHTHYKQKKAVPTLITTSSISISKRKKSVGGGDLDCVRRGKEESLRGSVEMEEFGSAGLQSEVEVVGLDAFVVIEKRCDVAWAVEQQLFCAG